MEVSDYAAENYLQRIEKKLGATQTTTSCSATETYRRKKKTGTKELEERTIRIILTKKHQYIRTTSGRKRVPTRAISTESMTGSQHDHWQEMNQESSFKDKQYS